MEEPRRPSLNDPAEFDQIRSMYFVPAIAKGMDLDPDERLERMNSGTKTNQSR